MKIKKLFKDLPAVNIKGPKETEVMGLCSDSRRVAPGDLFIAKKGQSHHGADFIAEAILAGANAVLTDFYNPFIKGITQVIVPNVAALEAVVASRFYEGPSCKLNTIGITGTNGKTTVAYLLHHLLSQHTCVGMIGTIEISMGKHRILSELTTPDCVTLHKLMKEMVHYTCAYCVLEITSIALDQGRVNGTHFDRLVFTNLSEDHLDYHTSLAKYAEAKASFFTPTYAKENAISIVNIDDPMMQTMVEQFPGEVWTYGFKEAATCRASHVIQTDQGVHFKLHYEDSIEEITLPMLGKHNVSNALAAIAVALSFNHSLHTIKKRLKTFGGVPGRLQKVATHKGTVFVDFAHTPDALLQTLHALKTISKGRLITVFGAGGNRDQDKRPLMGEVVSQLSDVAIVTSDNPRQEDPEAIIRSIQKGMQSACQTETFIDRKEAIFYALNLMDEEDTVLIAGKGHETHQILRHRTIDFDDSSVVKEWNETSVLTPS